MKAMKVLSFIKRMFKFKKEKAEMPFERAVIVSTGGAIEKGLDDDSNKRIYIYRGNEVYDKKPYSKSMVRTLQEFWHIPVYKPKESEFVEGEEVVPSEVYYEEI